VADEIRRPAGHHRQPDRDPRFSDGDHRRGSSGISGSQRGATRLLGADHRLPSRDAADKGVRHPRRAWRHRPHHNGADPEPVAKPGESTAKPGEPIAKPGEKEKEKGDGDSGGIERAVAEGNVEITQEKVGPNGKRQRYFGKARRAVFDNDKKTCVLYGWPRIAESSGENMGKETFALQENTVITLDQAGTINVMGHSKTRLTDLSGFELKEKDNGNR